MMTASAKQVNGTGASPTQSEHEIVKRIAETKLARGAHVLRDDLCFPRVDNVNRTTVLDEMDGVRTGVVKAFVQENDA